MLKIPSAIPPAVSPRTTCLGVSTTPRLPKRSAPLWEVHVDGVLADGVDADLVRSLATGYSGYLLASDRAHEVLAAEYGDWLRSDVHTV